MTADDGASRDVDVRLLTASAVGWCAVLVGVHGAWQGVLAAAGGCAVVGAAALVWSRRGDGRVRQWLPALALALWCSAAVLVPLAARLHAIGADPVRTLADQRQSVLAEVTLVSDPRPLSASAGGGSLVAIDARLDRVRVRQRIYRLHVAVVLLASGPGWPELLPGQRVRVDGRFAPARSGQLLAATITPRGPPAVLSGPSRWQRLAQRIRASLRAASAGLPPAERGLLPGLVDGDTSGLDPVLAQQFKVAGLTHLVAVSGTNVAVVVGAVQLVLRRAGVRPWIRSLVGAVALVGFVVVARPSPSVLRAALMAGILLVSVAGGRRRRGLPALGLATLVLLGWHPEWATDAGFAMSVLATGALLLIAPGWADALSRRGVPPGVSESVAVAAAATVVTAPVVVLLSGRLSLVAIPANLLAEAAVGPGTVLGVLAAVSAPWSLPVGALLRSARRHPVPVAGVGGRVLRAAARRGGELARHRPGRPPARPRLGRAGRGGSPARRQVGARGGRCHRADGPDTDPRRHHGVAAPGMDLHRLRGGSG